MYAFLFDKRSLSLVVTVCLLIGLLLFGAGMMTGARLQLDSAPSNRPQPLETMVGEYASPLGALSPPVFEPQQPAEPEETSFAPPPSTEPQPAPQPVRTPPPSIEPQQLGTEPQPAPQPVSTSPPSTEPQQQSIEPPPPTDFELQVAPPPPSAEPPPVSPPPRAEPMAGSTPPTERVEVGGFTIQVGAYRHRENAERRVAKLEHLAPYIEVVHNATNELFYTVRLGQFDSRRQAEEEATVISRKIGAPATEGTGVLVRPMTRDSSR